MSIHGRLTGAFAALAIVSEASAATIALNDKPGDITEATVILDAPPSEIYALVTDYAQWGMIFSDVLSVRVKGGGRDNARVEFKSRVLENQVTIEFANQPDQLITFRGVEGPRGGRARGSYLLTPIDGGARTVVTANLYLDVVGVPGLFVSDAKIKRMRQAKLRADLTDLSRRFPDAAS